MRRKGEHFGPAPVGAPWIRRSRPIGLSPLGAAPEPVNLRCLQLEMPTGFSRHNLTLDTRHRRKRMTFASVQAGQTRVEESYEYVADAATSDHAGSRLGT